MTNFYVICIVRMSRTCKDESHLQNAAQVLLIWQIVIVDGSEQNLLQWHRILQKARLAAPITDAQVRLALGFLRETEPEMQDINAFQMRYNAFFQPAEGVHYRRSGQAGARFSARNRT